MSYVKALLILSAAAAAHASKPSNILFVLTDDQDMSLGGLTPMVKLKELVIDQGTLFKNAFVTTPICCPSRSSILTGKYIHNHGAHNNSVQGNCAGTDWLNNNEKKTMAVYLKSMGYRTLFAGKYLNQYGTPSSPSQVTHIPPGWDSWLGLVGNSQYYDYAVSDNGVHVKHGSDYSSDYFTDVIANRSYDFVRNMSRDFPDQPFFMYLATPASHGPDTSAPQYENRFEGENAPIAPRTPNYNVWGNDKHWLMRYQIPLDARGQVGTDTTLRKRWRTLLSVDDMISNLIQMLSVSTTHKLKDTYIVFSSDNGYHLGQFCFGADKRQPYEADIRVPMAIRGPGIKQGVVEQSIALNIDLLPTFVELAGGVAPADVDGTSLVPLLLGNATTGSNRQYFLVDYYGEGENTACGLYGKCPSQRRGYDRLQGATDAGNNTYHCVRQLVTPQTNDTFTRMYCEFQDAEKFVELYEMKQDPYQLNNRAYSNQSSDKNVRASMHAKLAKFKVCAGPTCRAPQLTMGE